MKRTLLIALMIICCFGTILFAQIPTYDFLRIDISARAAALNGSFVSMRDDPNGLFYNPALIGTLTMPRISFTYLDHFMDVSAGSLCYGQYIKGIGNIGAGVTYINYGAIDRTDENMNVTGSFSPRELAFTGGIAFHYDEDILVGVNAKYIYSSIAEYSSYALAVDLGFLYTVESQKLSIGGSLLNMGQQFRTYAGTREPLPFDIKFGITKQPEHLPVLLNLDFHRLNETGSNFFDRFSNFTIGAELLMSETIRLRLGYNNKQRKDMKMGTTNGMAGFSIGGGITLRDYQIDYAYNSIGKNLEGIQRFSLGINF